MDQKKKIIFSVFGGLIFSIGDMAHVYSGIAQYPNWKGPWFFNIPFWVPIEFAVGALLLLHTLKLTIRKPSRSALGISFFWSLLIYLTTSALPESQPIIKNLVLFSALGLQIFWNRFFDLRSLLQIFGAAIVGCAFEFILGQMGVFVYQPSASLITSIPLWLPCIYASVAMTVAHAKIQLRTV
jgi:hypothetical protein